MAGCSCGAENKSAAQKILGLFVCVKTHQCFVTCVTEKALPILFWLEILGSFIVSFKLADNVSINGGAGAVLLTFFGTLIVGILFTFVVFYLIYLLKAIKDAVKKDEDSCGCEDNAEVEIAKEEDTAAKKRGRKPKATA
ncbi:MAG: hypothetical protein LBB59_08955 [Campylobacteraceae bacterium]|jgi:uncharacterized membrane protein|nr:hypothetical protein [Campylobacteraceae bacterium]